MDPQQGLALPLSAALEAVQIIHCLGYCDQSRRQKVLGYVCYMHRSGTQCGLGAARQKESGGESMPALELGSGSSPGSDGPRSACLMASL